jgi:PAS domain S-box-containing protein
MIFLDIRTIIFSCIITNLVSTMVMFFLWMQNHNRFKGTTYWIANFGFQTLTFTLIALRGHIPDWVSINLANTITVIGALLGNIGLECFLNKKSTQIHNYLLIVVFTFIHYWFTFINPNLPARNLNIAIAGVILFSQASWLLLVRVNSNIRKTTLGMGLVFVAFSLINLLRIFNFFINNHIGSDYFHSGQVESIILLVYQMLFMLLTYSLALMFNKSLIAAILSREEIFSKAFHTTPYSITLSRFPDGEIIKFNLGFLNISGYSASEVKDKATTNLDLWVRNEDWEEAVNELIKNGKVYGKEYQFRKKSGEKITGLFSAELIEVNQEKCVISSINDITDQKRAQQVLNDSKVFAQSTIDALSQHLCVLDETGTIISVNKAWKDFADSNPPIPNHYCIGDNYLKICKEAKGEYSSEAIPFAKGLRSVINGEKDFFTMEYPCNTPGGETRWFSAYVTRFGGENSVRILVVHNNITLKKQAEEVLLLKMSDLERFNELTVNRELKMIELKKEINHLLLKLGEKTRYKIIE